MRILLQKRFFHAPSIVAESIRFNSPDRGADDGLFVSWSGFKSNEQKELVASFFKVRLWT